MKRTHRHRPLDGRTEGPLPYFHPVTTDPGKANRKAHGGVRWREVCACGARREVNANGVHQELGPWQTGRRADHESR